MDFKKELNDISEGFAGGFSKLTKVLDAHLAQIPDEAMKDLAPTRADIQRIVKSVKDGDVDAINEIKNKYAESNR
tara:strand:+ start:704 stop:928 length:225 start_codon:yes stop_codon:yes gene_type:complete